MLEYRYLPNISSRKETQIRDNPRMCPWCRRPVAELLRVNPDLQLPPQLVCCSSCNVSDRGCMVKGWAWRTDRDSLLEFGCSGCHNALRESEYIFIPRSDVLVLGHTRCRESVLAALDEKLGPQLMKVFQAGLSHRQLACLASVPRSCPFCLAGQVCRQGSDPDSSAVFEWCDNPVCGSVWVRDDNAGVFVRRCSSCSQAFTPGDSLVVQSPLHALHTSCARREGLSLVESAGGQHGI